MSKKRADTRAQAPTLAKEIPQGRHTRSDLADLAPDRSESERAALEYTASPITPQRTTEEKNTQPKRFALTRRSDEERLSIEEAPAPLGGTIFVLLLAFMFVLGVGAYALIGLPAAHRAEELPSPTQPESTTDPISIGISEGKAQLMADLMITMEETYLTVDETRPVHFMIKKSDRERNATAQEVLTLLSPIVPQELLRALDPSIAYTITSGRPPTAYATIPIRSESHALAALLSWEGNMPQAFAQFLDPIGTTRKESEQLYDARFVDVRLPSGKDVRVLSRGNGKTALAYMLHDGLLFVAPNTLILTTLTLPTDTSTSSTTRAGG